MPRGNTGHHATGRMTPEEQARHLTSPHIDDVCRVTISTIQRRYSTLHGEELAKALGNRPRDAACNPAVPIEKFDCIATDECHRSIYNLWRQVLEYFDASLIGLTATPAPQTIAHLHQNRVTEAGGKVEKGFLIDHRSKASRKARAEVLADDLDVTGKPVNGYDLIKDFCNSTLPRLAVTADMIAAGNDFKPLQVDLFLCDPARRDGRFYCEQVKRRATRELAPTDLQSVSGDDTRAKPRFVIADAVGVCESDKIESRPIDRQPTVPLKTLLQRIIFPVGRYEDTLTTLAALLARFNRELEPAHRQQIVNKITSKPMQKQNPSAESAAQALPHNAQFDINCIQLE